MESSSALLIHQVGRLVRRINFQSLECARCEMVYSLRETLPRAYLQEYTMVQEHFDAVELVRRFVHLSVGTVASKQRTEKLVVYTRSDNTILQLVANDSFAAATLGDILSDTDGNAAEVSIVSDHADIPSPSRFAKVLVLPLASFRTSNACEQTLRGCMNLTTASAEAGGKIVLLVVADMRQCGSRHVTAARRFVDEGFVHLYGSSRAPPLVVIFILHVPPQRLHLRSCYQTIPINGWSSVYVDNFSTQVKLTDEAGREGELQPVPVPNSSVRQWINLIMGITSENQSAVIIDEFRALSRDALWHAIQSCKFKQTQVGERARRETFSAMGIDLSMPAYFDGRHDWVFQQLDSRPGIVNAIVSIFTELWATMLSRIVEEACVSITRAATSKGLLQTLQTSFKWLLSDFMNDTVKRYIGAMWTLESIAAMDTLQGEVDIADSSSEVLESLGRSEIFHFIFLNALYHSIFVNAGSQLYLHDLEANSSSLTKSVKGCWEVPHAPTVPLFLVIAAALEELIFFARHLVKEDGDLYMPEVSELERELNVIHKMVEDVSSFASKKWKYLIRIIRAVETNRNAWESWQLDFLRLSLACHQRSAADNALLRVLTQQIVADVRRNFSIVRRSDESVSDRDICLWTMLRSRLRRELGGTIALLDFVKGLVPESRIGEIADILGAMEAPMEAMQDQESLEHVQGQEQTTMGSVVAMVLSSGLDEMWQRLNSLGEHDIVDWMSRMRVLMSLVPANPAATARLLTPTVFCRLCLMHLVYVAFGIVDNNVCFQWLRILQPMHVQDVEGFPHALYNTLEVLISLAQNGDPVAAAVQQVAIEALNWVLSAQETQPIGSTIIVFLSALLGLDATAGTVLYDATMTIGANKARTTRQFVAQRLSFGVRLELLKMVLYCEKHGIYLQMVDELLTSRDVRQGDGTCYFPTVVMSAVVENHWLIEKVFRPSQVVEDRPDAVQFRGGDSPHTLLFQVIHATIGHDKLQSSDLLNQIEFCRLGYLECDRVMGRTAKFSLLLSMRRSSFAIHLINDWITYITQRIQADAMYSANSSQISVAVSQIVSSAPRIWSAYLFSRVKDISVIVELVHNERFCGLIGTPWWYVERVDDAAGPGNDIQSIIRFRDLKIAAGNRVAGVRFATALVDFEIQRQQMELPLMMPLLSMTAPPNLPEEDIRSKAAKLIHQLVDIDFNNMHYMNTYIPTICALVHFVKDNFSNRLTEAECRTVPFDELLDMLPPVERVQGQRLFKEFLGGWSKMKSIFQTYVVCPREVAGAAEMPVLTDRYGERPTTAADLVEIRAVSDSTAVHESSTARILEQRLLKQTAEFLSGDLLQGFRGNEQFNRHNWLLESDLKIIELESLSIQRGVGSHLLLTGLEESRAKKNRLERLVYLFSSWVSDTAAPVASADLANQTVDIAAMIRESQYEEAFQNHMFAHADGMVVCPNCGLLGRRGDGCNHLRCGFAQRSSDNQGYQARIGCGTNMDVNANRVPAIVRGQQPHAVFFPERVATFDALNLGIQDLPPVTFPRGHYEFDWVAIARHFVKELLAGKAEIRPSASFFDPLPLFLDDTKPNALDLAFEFSAKGDDDSEGSVNMVREPTAPQKQRGNGHSSTPLKPSSGASTSQTSAAPLLQSMLESLSVLPSSSVFIKLRAISTMLERGINQIQPVTKMMDINRITVRNYATRLSEQGLEAACDELYSLSLSAVNLLDEAGTEWIRSPLRQLMDRTNAPASGWSPLLRSAIEALTTSSLPAISLCVLEVSNEKSFTKDASLNSDLSESLCRVFADVSEELERELNAHSENIDEKRTLLLDYQRELQMIGSTLEEQTEHLLSNVNEEDSLRKMKFLQGYVNRTHSGAARLLNKMLSKSLKVKHFGPLMRFIRQLLGRLMHELVHLSNQHSRGSLVREADNGGEEKTFSNAVNAEGGDDRLGKIGLCRRKRGTWLDKFKRTKSTGPVKVYRELVPSDWEDKQNRDVDESIRTLLNNGFDVAGEPSFIERENETETWDRDWQTDLVKEDATVPHITAFDNVREQRFSRFLYPNAAERFDGDSFPTEEINNENNEDVLQLSEIVIQNSDDDELISHPGPVVSDTASISIPDDLLESSTLPSETGDGLSSASSPPLLAASQSSSPPVTTGNTSLPNIAQLLPMDDDWRNETQLRELFGCDDGGWEKLLALGLLKAGKATKKFGTRYQIQRDTMLETLLSDEATHNLLPTNSPKVQREIHYLLERFYCSVVVDTTGMVLRLFDRAWLGGPHWVAVLAVIEEASAALRCSCEDFLRLASLGAVHLEFMQSVFRSVRDGTGNGASTAGMDWTGALRAEEIRSYEELQEELSFNRREFEELLEREGIRSFSVDGKYFILTTEATKLLEEELEDI